jgi:uncharacterized protein YxjI
MFRRGAREGGGETPPNVYVMREKMLSIGDDFWIEKGGQRAYRVDGKALRVRETLVFEDPQGREVATIKEKIVAIRDTMTIERGGQVVATIKKALISPFRDRFVVELASGGELKIQGNIVAHNYKFERDGREVAEVSKKGLAIRDTYGVEIQPGQDDALILAATVALDQMAHDIG